MVADSSGWVEEKLLIKEESEFAESEYFYYIVPEELANSPAFDGQKWVETYGECPNFCLSYEACKYILAVCDEYDLIVEIVRTKDKISCLINYEDSEDLSPTIILLNELPDLISLAITLSWLKFVGYNRLNLQLIKSCLSCKYVEIAHAAWDCKHPSFSIVDVSGLVHKAEEIGRAHV